MPAFVVRCSCDAGPNGEGGETVVDHIRLFPVIEGVRWTYRVHEQILPALKRAGLPVQWTDITVRHTGYADRDLRSRKLDRDSRILREELAERPDDPFTLFVRHDDRVLIADPVSRILGRRYLSRPTYLRSKDDRDHSLLVKRRLTTKCPYQRTARLAKHGEG